MELDEYTSIHSLGCGTFRPLCVDSFKITRKLFFLCCTVYIPKPGMYIPRFGTYIPNFGMYIPRLGIYIW